MDEALLLQNPTFDEALEEALRLEQAYKPAHTAHVVNCGRWSLAFGIRWINVLIDEFELVSIPGAPPWLIGAVNIEGAIVPVADLAAYFEPGVAPQALTRHHRLMLGGRQENSNEDAVALLFSGLPNQLAYDRLPLNPSQELPERLREICWGRAAEASFEINTDKLLSTLSLDLM
jgi:chemotaxis signal transduction protein